MAKKKKAEQEQPAKQAEVKSNVTIEDIGPCKKKITVEVPESKIKENLDNKYKELKKDAMLPGFRKGRAPLRLLEKRYGTDIHKQAKLELMIDAAQTAMKDNNLDVLGDPNIDHEKVELPETGPMTFSFEVEVRPEFELPELEGIEIEKPSWKSTTTRSTKRFRRCAVVPVSGHPRMAQWVPMTSLLRMWC
jgi:trigger factor